MTLPSGNYSSVVIPVNQTYWTHTVSDAVSYTVEKSYYIPKATVYNDGHIYSLYDDAMTWTDAKARCENLGGHLVTITSASEQSLVEGLFGNGTRGYYWIGASDAETEGTFKWVTGEAFSYTNWGSGQPDNWEGIEDYAHVYTTGDETYYGKWNDNSNSAGGVKFGFICEIEPVSFNPIATSQYGRNMYELYEDKMAWTDAKLFAESKGGHLVCIGSEAEQNAVFGLAKQGSLDNYLIGATDYNQSSWTWVDGSSFSYTNWRDGEPNCGNDGREFFGEMYRSDGKWNDLRNLRFDTVGFIIEYENAAAYTVTYDANGGTNAPEAQRKTKGENLTLTTNKPFKDGYEFIGWSTDKNATSPTYTAGATFSTDADTMLYAIWKQISSIEIVTMPDKLDYDTYELLDVSGMKLKVSYSDNSTRVITMGATVEGSNETVVDQESGTVFSPSQLTQIGTQEIIVNYAGVTTSFHISVDDPFLIGIEIESLPDKLVYNVGDALDTTGLVVLADNTTVIVPIEEGYTCTPTVLRNC